MKEHFVDVTVRVKVACEDTVDPVDCINECECDFTSAIALDDPEIGKITGHEIIEADYIGMVDPESGAVLPLPKHTPK